MRWTARRSLAAGGLLAIILLLVALFLHDAAIGTMAAVSLLLTMLLILLVVLLWRGAAFLRRRQRRRRALQAHERAHRLKPGVVEAAWRAEWLDRLDSRRLLRLCENFWIAKGHRVDRAARPDVDLLVCHRDSPDKVMAVVCCVSAAYGRVDVAAVEALRAARDQGSATLALFYGMGGFADTTLPLREDRQLRMIAAQDLLVHIGTLPPDVADALLRETAKRPRQRRRRR